MAPPPEYDKEPKAPDKSATNTSCEEPKALHNLMNDQQTNSDNKIANTTACGEGEKHVEALDDGQLRALLDEAITYKCPKDREGKSSLFKELLEEVEQDEQACEAAARGSSSRARRQGRGRRALPHSNSLQDLVAALAAEPAPRRVRHQHQQSHAPVSARAIHGGSLPSGVDTSFLLGEEPPRAGYLATVRCVNPPPLAERRVSASDANCPAEVQLLNRRSKPVFPMTYTARATLEIGSGSVCSGRALTTTTSSNQVRTRTRPGAYRLDDHTSHASNTPRYGYGHSRDVNLLDDGARTNRTGVRRKAQMTNRVYDYTRHSMFGGDDSSGESARDDIAHHSLNNLYRDSFNPEFNRRTDGTTDFDKYTSYRQDHTRSFGGSYQDRMMEFDYYDDSRYTPVTIGPPERLYSKPKLFGSKTIWKPGKFVPKDPTRHFKDVSKKPTKKSGTGLKDNAAQKSKDNSKNKNVKTAVKKIEIKKPEPKEKDLLVSSISTVNEKLPVVQEKKTDPNQLKLLRALMICDNDDEITGGGVSDDCKTNETCIVSKLPRGPREEPSKEVIQEKVPKDEVIVEKVECDNRNLSAQSQLWMKNVNSWYDSLNSCPFSQQLKYSQANEGNYMNEDSSANISNRNIASGQIVYNEVVPSTSSSIPFPFVSPSHMQRKYKSNIENKTNIPYLHDNYTCCRFRQNELQEDTEDFCDNIYDMNDSDLYNLRKEYRARVGSFNTPSLSSNNPPNIRKMTIGKPLNIQNYENPKRNYKDKSDNRDSDNKKSDRKSDDDKSDKKINNKSDKDGYDPKSNDIKSHGNSDNDKSGKDGSNPKSIHDKSDGNSDDNKSDTERSNPKSNDKSDGNTDNDKSDKDGSNSKSNNDKSDRNSDDDKPDRDGSNPKSNDDKSDRNFDDDKPDGDGSNPKSNDDKSDGNSDDDKSNKDGSNPKSDDDKSDGNSDDDKPDKPDGDRSHPKSNNDKSDRNSDDNKPNKPNGDGSNPKSNGDQSDRNSDNDKPDKRSDEDGSNRKSTDDKSNRNPVDDTTNRSSDNDNSGKIPDKNKFNQNTDKYKSEKTSSQDKDEVNAEDSICDTTKDNTTNCNEDKSVQIYDENECDYKPAEDNSKCDIKDGVSYCNQALDVSCLYIDKDKCNLNPDEDKCNRSLDEDSCHGNLGDFKSLPNLKCSNVKYNCNSVEKLDEDNPNSNQSENNFIHELVQRMDLFQSDFNSVSDKSNVTTADYIRGSVEEKCNGISENELFQRSPNEVDPEQNYCEDQPKRSTEEYSDTLISVKDQKLGSNKNKAIPITDEDKSDKDKAIYISEDKSDDNPELKSYDVNCNKVTEPKIIETISSETQIVLKLKEIVNEKNSQIVLAELPNNAYMFLTYPKSFINPHSNHVISQIAACTEDSAQKRNEVETSNKNAFKTLLFRSLFRSDSEKSVVKTAVKEVDSAIPFSCITTPEVVASCNTTSSTSQAAVAVDPKPLQLVSSYRAVANLVGAPCEPDVTPARLDHEQPRSVISSSFNGLPLSRPNYGSTASSAPDEYKKSLDENGNSVQGFSSPLSGSSQHKKPRRKKSSKNETVIKSHQIDGYQGNKDLNEVLRFIESNADNGRAQKLGRAKHKDDTDDKGKKRSTERRKDKESKMKRATSMEELSRTKLEDLTDKPAKKDRGDAGKAERRSWGDDARESFYYETGDMPADADFQTVTKKRKPRRRADDPADPPPARAPSPRARRVSAPPSDRSNDSNDDLDSVHSLPAAPPPPAAAPPAPAPAPASYADIARTRHNIPDLIESCNYYPEGVEAPAAPRADADADGYPALEPRAAPRRIARDKPAPPPDPALCITHHKERPESSVATEGPAPDVVADRRPPVILLDSTQPRDMDGITFGFDINEQLLGGTSRRPRCDLVRSALEGSAGGGGGGAGAGAAGAGGEGAGAGGAVAAGCGLRYVPPCAAPDPHHLHLIVDYVTAAWEDVVRCGAGGGKVRYYSE